MSELDDRHMKPLLGTAVDEAVKLALIDSVRVPEGDMERSPTDAERRAWAWDIYAMPSECLATMDPGALAQNVAVRLLGPGGWAVGGVYSPNASPHQIVDACIERPDEDPVAGVLMDLGLRVDDNEPG